MGSPGKRTPGFFGDFSDSDLGGKNASFLKNSAFYIFFEVLSNAHIWDLVAEVDRFK